MKKFAFFLGICLITFVVFTKGASKKEIVANKPQAEVKTEEDNLPILLTPTALDSMWVFADKVRFYNSNEITFLDSIHVVRMVPQENGDVDEVDSVVVIDKNIPALTKGKLLKETITKKSTDQIKMSFDTEDAAFNVSWRLFKNSQGISYYEFNKNEVFFEFKGKSYRVRSQIIGGNSCSLVRYCHPIKVRKVIQKTASGQQ